MRTAQLPSYSGSMSLNGCRHTLLNTTPHPATVKLQAFLIVGTSTRCLRYGRVGAYIKLVIQYFFQKNSRHCMQEQETYVDQDAKKNCRPCPCLMFTYPTLRSNTRPVLQYSTTPQMTRVVRLDDLAPPDEHASTSHHTAFWPCASVLPRCVLQQVMHLF